MQEGINVNNVKYDIKKIKSTVNPKCIQNMPLMKMIIKKDEFASTLNNP